MLLRHYLVLALAEIAFGYSYLATRIYDFDVEHPNFVEIGDMLVQSGWLNQEDPRRKGNQLHRVDRWGPRGMYYGQISLPYNIQDESIREVAMAAMKVWEEKTCIRFEQVEEKDKDSKWPYIEFMARPKTCKSMLGKTPRLYNRIQKRYSDPQVVYIDPGYCRWERVVHLIGHSLGYDHTVMRHDRDKYVKIHKENIDEKDQKIFEKVPFPWYKGYSVPYDFASILHLRDWEYSNNSQPTIEALDPYFQTVLSKKVDGPSYYDNLQVVKDYKCDRFFRRQCKLFIAPNCVNGYLGPNCQCVCEPGVSGELCDIKDKVYSGQEIKRRFQHMGAKCGENITKEYVGYVISDQNTKEETNCLYQITAPEGNHIQLKVKAFQFDEAPNPKFRCAKSSVTFMDPYHNRIIRKCGNDMKIGSEIRFESDKVNVMVKSKDFKSKLGLEVIFISPSMFD